MTRTLSLSYLGITYKIKIRTIPNSDHSSIVVWRNETALTGISFTGVKSNKEAKIMAERMIEEYWDSLSCYPLRGMEVSANIFRDEAL